MFSLAMPWALLLTPLPFLLWWGAGWRYKKNQHTSKRKSSEHYILHPQAELLNTLQNESNNKRSLPWLWLFGCLLLLLALTKPQWIDINNPNNYQGHQMILAIDTSGSMQALDFIRHSKEGEVLIDRLTGVKEIVHRFLRKRRGDHIGLIVFADDVYVNSPISSDLSLLHSLINEIEQGIAGEKTALGDAIAIAVEQLKKTEQQSRLLILFTDGSNTAGSVSPDNAIRLAQHQGVRIYTIGIGTEIKTDTDAGVLFPQGPITKPIYAELPLNHTLLQRIADDTGGAFYQANDSKVLANIIQDISALEPIELEAQQDTHSADYFWLPLLLGLSLLVFYEWRYRKSTYQNQKWINLESPGRKARLP